MLELIFKGLVEWIYGMIVEIVAFITNSLLSVFSMDLTYFEAALPVAGDILNVVIAVGWALLLGNLVFQAAKSMMSGLGFEGDDPRTLFMRTAVFAFLLLASRQICDIGLGISKEVIILLQMPSGVSIHFPTGFTLGSAWLLQIIIGLVLMWQVVKLFFEVGERYFLVGFLTLMAPLAFSMGGSRNTSDVFKGWVRMFASMCLMMVLNVVFLKLLMSAMQHPPIGYAVFPWIIFVVAITRTARKIDMVITRIGLNPAMTGVTGRGLPGMLTYTIMRSITSNIAKAASGASKSRTPPAGRQNPSGASSAGNMGIPAGRGTQGGAACRGGSQSTSSTSNTNTSNTSATQNTQSTSQQSSGSAGTQPGSANTQSASTSPGVAGRSPSGAAAPISSANPGAAGAGVNTAGNPNTPAGRYDNSGIVNKTGQNTASQQSEQSTRSSNRRSSVTNSKHNARSSVLRTGAAGTPGGSAPQGTPPHAGQSGAPMHPPIPRAGQTDKDTPVNMASSRGDGQHRPDRFSSVPPSARGASERGTSPGAAGTSHVSGGTRNTQVQQGGASVNAQSQTNISADARAAHIEQNREVSATQNTNAPAGARSSVPSAYPGAAGADSRRSSVSPDKPQASAGRPPSAPTSPVIPVSPGAAGTANTRHSVVPPSNPAGRVSHDAPRGGGNPAPVSHGAPPVNASSPTPATPQARQESTYRRTEVPGTQKQPANTGSAVRRPPTAPNPTGRQSANSQTTTRIGASSSNRKKAKGQKKTRKGKGGKS